MRKTRKWQITSPSDKFTENLLLFHRSNPWTLMAHGEYLQVIAYNRNPIPAAIPAVTHVICLTNPVIDVDQTYQAMARLMSMRIWVMK